LGDLIGKNAVLAGVTTALALVRIAALTYGGLLLALLFVDWCGYFISGKGYSAILAGLQPVRGTLNFVSGWIGQISFGAVLVVAGARLYSRNYTMLLSEAGAKPAAKSSKPKDDRSIPNWFSLIALVLASPFITKKAKPLTKFSSTFASVVFCLSLVGVGGSEINQAIEAIGEGWGPSSNSPLTASNAVVYDGKSSARDSFMQQAESESAQESKKEEEEVASDEIGDEEFTELVSAAMVDAIAESPSWQEIMTEADAKDLLQLTVSQSFGRSSGGMVATILDMDTAKFGWKEKFAAVDQSSRRKIYRWVLKQGVPKFGVRILDKTVEFVVDEGMPDYSDPLADKSVKVFSKAAKSGIGQYLQKATEIVGQRMKNGEDIFEALQSLRTLHRIELPAEDAMKLVATIRDANAGMKEPLLSGAAHLPGLSGMLKGSAANGAEDLRKPEIRHSLASGMGAGMRQVDQEAVLGVEAACALLRARVKTLRCRLP
jgi:hypothetical protein